MPIEMKIFCAGLALGIFGPYSYDLQRRWANWLYINHRNSFLRKIWPSEYDSILDYDLEKQIEEYAEKLYSTKYGN